MAIGLVAVATCHGAAVTTSAPADEFFVLENGIADELHATPDLQARALKELGVEGIGPYLRSITPEYLAAFDHEHIKISSLYAQVWINSDNPRFDPHLPNLIRRLKGRATLVWLTIQSGKDKPSTQEADESAVAIIRELADVAAASHLRIALYPHVGFWQERVEDAVRIARKADRPNVGVTFNLCHWLKVDRPETLKTRLEFARPYLFSVTINGADADAKNWDKLIQPLDRGSYDLRILLSELRKAGYQGSIGLQCYGVKGDKYENLKRSMATWRKLSATAHADTSPSSNRP